MTPEEFKAHERDTKRRFQEGFSLGEIFAYIIVALFILGMVLL